MHQSKLTWQEKNQIEKIGEGCLEGCGVKNPQGAISTLLTTFISGGSLANIRYNHNAWLGMLGTTSGGNGGHTALLLHTSLATNISGWKKMSLQNKQLVNYFRVTILDQYLTYLYRIKRVMGVMNVLSKADQPPAAAKECDNAPCAIRTMLKTCDPLIFAGKQM